MKTHPLFALLVAGCTAFGQASKELEADLFVLKDPRWGGGRTWPSEYSRDGKSLPNSRSMPSGNCILIIARMYFVKEAPPQSDYEIGGIDGRHSAERVEAFLRAFYARPEGDQKKEETSNVLLLGNEWAAGGEVFPVLKSLSKDYEFSVYAVMAPFKRVELMPEPKERLAAIRSAFEASSKR